MRSLSPSRPEQHWGAQSRGAPLQGRPSLPTAWGSGRKSLFQGSPLGRPDPAGAGGRRPRSQRLTAAEAASAFLPLGLGEGDVEGLEAEGPGLGHFRGLGGRGGRGVAEGGAEAGRRAVTRCGQGGRGAGEPGWGGHPPPHAAGPPKGLGRELRALEARMEADSLHLEPAACRCDLGGPVSSSATRDSTRSSTGSPRFLFGHLLLELRSAFRGYFMSSVAFHFAFRKWGHLDGLVG